MFDLIEEYTDVNISRMDVKDLVELIASNDIELTPGLNYGQLIDKLFGEIVEPNLINPTFVLDYPASMSPLAKKKRDCSDDIVERFELFICGMEFANSFSEQNDPHEQKLSFMDQTVLREAGDDEAHVLDENFIEAMEVGMPPTGGVGIGIDRLVMLLTKQHSIKDVILFPTLRPED